MQGGLRLFHPDHITGLTYSEEIWRLITQYSQAYLEQSRSYLGKLQSYQQRLLEYHKQYLLEQEKKLTLSELETRIDKLRESQQEMYHKFMQNFSEMEADLEAKWKQDLDGVEARWKQYLVDNGSRWKQYFEAKFESKLDKLFSPSTQQQQASTPSASDTEMPGSSNSTHLFRH